MSDRQQDAENRQFSKINAYEQWQQAANAMPGRCPHAVIDLPSRYQKACKIERLLALANRRQPLNLLEIGTGCGGIAHYFATHSGICCTVDAVDVIDQRAVRDSYRFRLVEDVFLPYPDDSFDVVLTNHVIEHVGTVSDQKMHLHEIHRVLKKDGVGYLAVPNRWMAVEPHYRLFGLSWLPRRLRTPYLKLCGKGTYYDCEPLTLREIERFLKETGFRFENVTTRAIRETVLIEGSKSLQWKAANLLPNAALNALARFIPTLIYVLTPTKYE
jgi:SAM-dependent methyltransferase